MEMGNNKIDILHRKRIFDLLQKSLEYTLTLVIAGAGYGKTTAVNSFLQESSAKALWYQLTLLDTNTTRFWDNFTLRMTSYNPDFFQNMNKLGFPDTKGKSNIFFQMLINLLEPETKHIIVLDDFHIIQDIKLMLFIEQLVNANIPNLYIIIISRTYPIINTISLMSRGQLLEINEDELRFNENEILEYFYIQAIIPSDSIVSKIYKQTNGWILAIYLTGLSLKLKPSAGNFALTSMKLNVFKLIESEIYEPLSDSNKLFLVTLSLFETLPSELLHELAGNNKELISSITNITSFIRYDTYENTYHFHHLFLDFLRKKQDILTEQHIKSAYITAAKWYVNNNCKIDALLCYKNAKEYKQMLLVIITFPTMLSSSLIQYFLDMIESITDMKDELYLAKIVYARYFNQIKSREETIALLSELKEIFEQLPPSQNKSYLICALYSIIGTYNMLSFGRDFYKPFKVAYLTGSRVLATTVYSVGNYAAHLLETGSFNQFMKEIDLTMPYMTHVLNGCGSGYNDLCKGEYAYFQRDFNTATNHLLQAKSNAKKEKQYYIEDMSLFYMLRIRISQGNYDDVIQIINQLKQQTQIYPYTDYFTMFAVASGWFYAQIGQADKSSVWQIKDLMEPKDMTNTNACGSFQLLLARCYLAEKKFYECIALLESLENEAIIKYYFYGKLEVAVIKAVTLFHINKNELALKMFQTAYGLSRSNGFIMPFVELGNHMVALTKFALKFNGSEKKLDIPNEWLINIHRKSSAYAKKVSYLANEYEKNNASENKIYKTLTKKELECLQDLCKGLSRAEIAADRNLSENYIKLLILNIYSKLGVKNSKEAIRIATLNNLV